MGGGGMMDDQRWMKGLLLSLGICAVVQRVWQKMAMGHFFSAPITKDTD